MEDPGGLPMPSGLTSSPERRGNDRANWEAWLGRLPRVVGDIAAHWNLRIGAPFQPGGHTSWVAPARTAEGDPVVVKVTWPHFEAEHEADGLRLWDGRGAVKLLDAITLSGSTDPSSGGVHPGDPADHPPRSRTGCGHCRTSAAALGDPAGWPFPPTARDHVQSVGRCNSKRRETGRPSAPADSGLIRQGIELLRLLPTDTETNAVLCTDLHAGNVLSSTREPWLMIDPKPYVGDPAYDLIQHLLNCRERLHADPRGLAERVAGLCGLESDRVGRWLFARCVQESHQWPDLLDVARAVDPA